MGWRAFAKQVPILNKPVNIRTGIRVVENVFHIQNVDVYASRLMKWMLRIIELYPPAPSGDMNQPRTVFATSSPN
jgi:hypothetical protein